MKRCRHISLCIGLGAWLSLCAGLASSVHGQEDAPPAPAASTNAVESVPQEGEAETTEVRDPFWPVGYVPKAKPVAARLTPAPVIDASTGDLAPVVAPAAPKGTAWEAARKQLHYQGISRFVEKIPGRKTGKVKYQAFINGKLVEEGQVVEAVLDDFVYRFKVTSITSKSINFSRLDTRPR